MPRKKLTKNVRRQSAGLLVKSPKKNTVQKAEEAVRNSIQATEEKIRAKYRNIGKDIGLETTHAVDVDQVLAGVDKARSQLQQERGECISRIAIIDEQLSRLGAVSPTKTTVGIRQPDPFTVSEILEVVKPKHQQRMEEAAIRLNAETTYIPRAGSIPARILKILTKNRPHTVAQIGSMLSDVSQSSLYPTLDALHKRGVIKKIPTTGNGVGWLLS